jgi:uncharacterized protein
VHFEIGTHDAERSRSFYRALFGWEIGSEDYAVVDTRSETGIRGGSMQVPTDVPAYVTFYVGVADLERTLQRVAQLGGRKVIGPMPIAGMGAFAMFADLDGNVVGLFEEGS